MWGRDGETAITDLCTYGHCCKQESRFGEIGYGNTEVFESLRILSGTKWPTPCQFIEACKM